VEYELDLLAAARGLAAGARAHRALAGAAADVRHRVLDLRRLTLAEADAAGVAAHRRRVDAAAGGADPRRDHGALVAGRGAGTGGGRERALVRHALDDVIVA